MTNIPLYVFVYIYIYMPNLYPFVCWRRQITSISWLIMLLWILGYMYLFKLVFLFFSYTYLVLEMLDLLTVLFLVFWGASILFSRVATPIHNPTNSVQRFSFLCILTNICYLWLFWWFWQVWSEQEFLKSIFLIYKSTSFIDVSDFICIWSVNILF